MSHPRADDGIAPSLLGERESRWRKPGLKALVWINFFEKNMTCAKARKRFFSSGMRSQNYANLTKMWEESAQNLTLPSGWATAPQRRGKSHRERGLGRGSGVAGWVGAGAASGPVGGASPWRAACSTSANCHPTPQPSVSSTSCSVRTAACGATGGAGTVPRFQNTEKGGRGQGGGCMGLWSW